MTQQITYRLTYIPKRNPNFRESATSTPEKWLTMAPAVGIDGGGEVADDCVSREVAEDGAGG